MSTALDRIQIGVRQAPNSLLHGPIYAINALFEYYAEASDQTALVNRPDRIQENYGFLLRSAFGRRQQDFAGIRPII